MRVGLTAAIYGARARVSTHVFETAFPGGQIVSASWVENYPGFPEGISGFDLASKMQEQAKKFGLEIRLEEVLKIENNSNALEGKTINTDENIYKASAVILATGANFKSLNVPGEKDFLGKGISYCATCDGPFFKGKNVVVVGGGQHQLPPDARPRERAAAGHLPRQDQVRDAGPTGGVEVDHAAAGQRRGARHLEVVAHAG